MLTRSGRLNRDLIHIQSAWLVSVGDWSLITGRGGLQNGRGGGHVKFYPSEKSGGGGEKRFSHPEGGLQKVLG